VDAKVKGGAGIGGWWGDAPPGAIVVAGSTCVDWLQEPAVYTASVVAKVAQGMVDVG